MSCVCPWNRWSALRSSSWNHKKKKSGTKEGFLFLFVMLSLIETWGFKRKVVIFFPHLSSWQGLLQTLDILKSVYTYPSELMEATRMPQRYREGFKGLCMRNRRNSWVICPLLSRKLISWNNLVYLRYLLEFFLHMMNCFFQKRTREVSWQRWW